jgi:hypothetical protein
VFSLVLWRYLELGGIMYEVGLGVIAGFIPFAIESIVKKPRKNLGYNN